MPSDTHRATATRVLALLLLALVAACVPATSDLPRMDFNVRVSAPEVAPSQVLPLRVGVAAILSPESSFASYADLVAYLGEELGRPTELIQRRTYKEINDLLEVGSADIGFVCTSGYVLGHDDFGMELVAAPQVAGATTYHAALIVPADSPARSIADLRGATFAFTDPWSSTGRLYPTMLVREIGEDPETFFDRIIYTYSHDRAIVAVADGVADGASVDSLVLDSLLTSKPGLADRIRIIARSPDFAIPPVVASPRLSVTQRVLVAEALQQLDRTPQGRAILLRLGIDRFVPIDDAAYGPVRELLRKAKVEL